MRSKENLYLRKMKTCKDIMIICSKTNPYIKLPAIGYNPSYQANDMNIL